MALLVGGTGLYLRAVARGLDLDALPDDPAIRARLEAEFAAEGLEPLAARLQAIAPTLAVGDPPRQPAPGHPGARDRRAPGRRVPTPTARLRRTGGVDRARAWRATNMRGASRPGPGQQFDAGLIEEAVALRERFDPSLPAFSAIGYQEAWAVVDGTLSLEAAIEQDARRNVAFAKRQRTWFRAEPDIAWLDATAGDPFEASLAAAMSILD